MNWVLFYVWEDAKGWAHWNHSFDMYLSCLGPASCVFPSWVSSACTVGRWLRADGLMAGMLFLSCGAALMWWLDGCNILCLLIWQATFFHSQLIYSPNTRNLSWARCQPEHWNYKREVTLFALNHSPVAEPTLQADNLQDSGSTLVVNTDMEELMFPWKSWKDS